MNVRHVRGRWLVLLLAIWIGSCAEEDGVCDGEDHRPQLPAAANACHEAGMLKVRADECIAGFYEAFGTDGLISRNAELAYQYARADHASDAEFGGCEVSAADYEVDIADAACAEPSSDCGLAAGGSNACHDYYREMMDYQQRCMPDLIAATGMDSYDGKLDAWYARADYATDTEQTSTCGGSAYSYYASANQAGTCYR
jgi:hypothetical protein